MLVLEIKVTPSSGKQICVLDKTKNLKCFLKSAPERGKANAELVKLLSKKLRVEQDAISIISGEASRKKLIKIDVDVSFEYLCEQLGIELQTTLV